MTAIAPRKLLWKKTEPSEEALPQGIVVGCKGGKHSTTAMIDTGDVHVLMIGAAGVGKTAFWLYPCIEYACASGMSFLSTDTKGDVMRNYGNIAKDYGYKVSVIDLRNPTRSNGNNILYLVNKYTDLYAADPDQIVYKAKAEKYAKIISKTIILSGMDAASFGQNAYFYDAAEGLLTATAALRLTAMRAIMQTAKQNTEVLKTLKLHIGMGLTDETTEDKTLDIQIRIAELDAEFQKMLKAVSADNADAIDEERIAELMSEKQRLTMQLEQYAAMRQKRESAKSRLDEIYTILDGLQNHPMEYDDKLVRQIIECIVVESKEKIKVVFIGGTEIEMAL